MTNPIYSYSRSGRDSAVTRWVRLSRHAVPGPYQGVYLLRDFAQNWIRYLTLNGCGQVTGGGNFLPADGSADGPYDPVMLKPGPDGSLYYVDFGWGWQSDTRIRRRFGDPVRGRQSTAVATVGDADATAGLPLCR